MIVTNTEFIPGYEIEVLGVVFGNTVRAKHIGKDIIAGLKNAMGLMLDGCGYAEFEFKSKRW